MIVFSLITCKICRILNPTIWTIAYCPATESYFLLLPLGYTASVKRFVSPQFLNIIDSLKESPWTGDEPVAGPLPTQNKSRRTSISRVAFEPTIPEFERPETVHVLDRAAALIDMLSSSRGQFKGNAISNTRNSHLWVADIPHGTGESTSKYLFPVKV
jgi:hypothetical protein